MCRLCDTGDKETKIREYPVDGGIVGQRRNERAQILLRSKRSRKMRSTRGERCSSRAIGARGNLGRKLGNNKFGL